MNPVREWNLVDETATMALGGRLARVCGAGAVVFLSGGLGAGKTSLVRGWLRALGLEGTIKSPTYTLVEPYQISGFQVFHIDLYRLTDPEELELIGIRDYFADGHLVFVEWPERGAGVLPTPDLIIEISLHLSGRLAKVRAQSVHGQHCLAVVSDSE